MIGDRITGTVVGVPVSGFRTERGIYVLDILDGRPLDTWLGAVRSLDHGRMTPRGPITIRGEYLLDE